MTHSYAFISGVATFMLGIHHIKITAKNINALSGDTLQREIRLLFRRGLTHHAYCMAILDLCVLTSSTSCKKRELNSGLKIKTLDIYWFCNWWFYKSPIIIFSQKVHSNRYFVIEILACMISSVITEQLWFLYFSNKETLTIVKSMVDRGCQMVKKKFSITFFLIRFSFLFFFLFVCFTLFLFYYCYLFLIIFLCLFLLIKKKYKNHVWPKTAKTRNL